MILVIADVLDAAAVKQLRAQLSALKFVPGEETASDGAKRVKNNLQADMTTPEYAKLNASLLPVIGSNEMFKHACMPMKFTRLRFSRYRDNMAYGAHIDAPMMSDVRSDLSFTLFLAEPEEYDGGELIIEEQSGARSFKPKSGHMVVYPSTTLHRVAPVTRGERLAAFGWAQSLVRDAARRETLYDIHEARQGLIARDAPMREREFLGKAYSNLVRMWVEP